MAKKSKTQRAKASAARQARKAQAAEREAQAVEAVAEESASEKKGLFKSRTKDADKKSAAPAKKSEEKKPAKATKQRFKFLRDVKAEMKRVTWPTRSEVLRWTGVVVAALIFFGVFVAVLDNLIITPLMVALSGIGA